MPVQVNITLYRWEELGPEAQKRAERLADHKLQENYEVKNMFLTGDGGWSSSEYGYAVLGRLWDRKRAGKLK